VFRYLNAVIYLTCNAYVAIYMVALDPDAVNIIQLVPCILFFLGADLMVVAMHPNMMKSDYCWRLVTCDYDRQVSIDEVRTISFNRRFSDDQVYDHDESTEKTEFTNLLGRRLEY
jgi:hypothetical protein